MEQQGTDDQPTISPVFVLVFYGALAAAGFIYAGLVGDDDIMRHGTEAPLLWQVGAGLGLGLSTVLLSRLASKHLSWARALNREFKSVLGELSGPAILALAAGSAIGEELLFRGAMHPHLGLVPTAIIFGLVHFPRDRKLWPWTGFAIVMGFLLGWMVDVTGSLVGPIIAHFTINYFNLYALTETDAEGGL